MSLGRTPSEKLDGEVGVEVGSGGMVEDLLSFFTMMASRMKRRRIYRTLRIEESLEGLRLGSPLIVQKAIVIQNTSGGGIKDQLGTGNVTDDKVLRFAGGVQGCSEAEREGQRGQRASGRGSVKNLFSDRVRVASL